MKKNDISDDLKKLSVEDKSNTANSTPESPKEEATDSILKTPENSPKKPTPNAPKRKRKQDNQDTNAQIPVPDDLGKLVFPQNMNEKTEQGYNNSRPKLVKAIKPKSGRKSKHRRTQSFH